jgi:hypothetical protein
MVCTCSDTSEIPVYTITGGWDLQAARQTELPAYLVGVPFVGHPKIAAEEAAGEKGIEEARRHEEGRQGGEMSVPRGSLHWAPFATRVRVHAARFRRHVVAGAA